MLLVAVEVVLVPIFVAVVVVIAVVGSRSSTSLRPPKESKLELVKKLFSDPRFSPDAAQKAGGAGAAKAKARAPLARSH